MTLMDASRRRAVVFVIPLIVAFVAARKALPNVRTVDFLLAFASGIIVGVTLLRLIQVLRAPKSPE